MREGLPIQIIEPVAERKSVALAQALSLKRRGRAVSAEPQGVAVAKQRLKGIREYARENMNALAGQLAANLMRRYPQLSVVLAADGREAVAYISAISHGVRTLSINNSSVVIRELKPGLTGNGFTVINSYRNEFDVREKTIHDYWDLPCLLEKEENLRDDFDVSISMAGLEEPRAGAAEVKRYLALLGVNAVSAEDGSVFFLEHFTNIHRDLTEAQKVILVIGLDKIAATREDAQFVTQCMGIFGMESVLLGIQPEEAVLPSIAELSLPPADSGRELHIILLDNGRANLLKTKYESLLLCIGCRACNRRCPIRYAFGDAGYLWTPKNYLHGFLDERVTSLDTCLHCEACRAECPLDIDLPGLMWAAKQEYISRNRRPLYHRILGSPELLARIGTFTAPLANRIKNIGPARVLMEYMVGIDRSANLPDFNFQTFRKWFARNGQ
jgi:L-lactate utilization protein LutB